MNPLIRELAIKAEGTKKHVPAVWQFYDSELQEFAEMLVQECLNTLCVKMDDLGYDLSNLPLWYKVLSQTEKHFGIE